jgi:hypothetical protein
MSYRNDHDAALLRVDALEAELETLRLAYERQRAKDDADKPPRKRRSRTRWIVAGVMLAVTAGTAVGAVTLFHATTERAREPEPAAVQEIEIRPAIADRTQLRECREAITPLTTRRTAATTDPRGEHKEVASLANTGAPCRRLLANAERLEIGPELRTLVAKWSRAEDELLGCITRTLVYYGGDPYAADGYASAPQLWKEYDRAISARDAVLEQLAPAL